MWGAQSKSSVPPTTFGPRPHPSLQTAQIAMKIPYYNFDFVQQTPRTGEHGKIERAKQASIHWFALKSVLAARPERAPAFYPLPTGSPNSGTRQQMLGAHAPPVAALFQAPTTRLRGLCPLFSSSAFALQYCRILLYLSGHSFLIVTDSA